MAITSFPLLALVVVSAPIAVPVVFGPAWADVVLPMQILAVTGMRHSVQTLGGPLLMSQGRARAVMQTSFAGFVCVAASLVVGLRGGIVGVAVAYSLGDLIVFPVLLRLLHTSLGLRPRQYLMALVPALLGCCGLVAAWIVVSRVPFSNDALTLVVASIAAVGAYVVVVARVAPRDVARITTLLGARQGRGRAADAPSQAPRSSDGYDVVPPVPRTGPDPPGEGVRGARGHISASDLHAAHVIHRSAHPIGRSAAPTQRHVPAPTTTPSPHTETPMDTFTILSRTLRRWYVAVPVLVLAFGAALVLSSRQQTTYSASGSVILRGPSISLNERGEIVESNPYLNFNSALELSALATFHVIDSPSTRSVVAQAGHYSTYTVVQDGPILTFTVSGEAEATVVETIQQLAEETRTKLSGMQLEAGAPDAGQILVDVLAVPDRAASTTTSRTKVFVPILGLGLVAAVTAAMCLDAWLSWRGAQRREADELDAAPGDRAGSVDDHDSRTRRYPLPNDWRRTPDLPFEERPGGTRHVPGVNGAWPAPTMHPEPRR
jgi:hypothetical protein